jgi:hypothetical protein
LSQINGVIGPGSVEEAGNGEGGIERQSCLGRRPRFVDAAEKSQRGREPEMRDRLIPVVLDGAAEPRHRCLIGAQVQFGGAGPRYPDIGRRVARREAERLRDMGLCLLAATDAYLRVADIAVRHGEIAIEPERALALGDALQGTIGENLDVAQDHVSPVMRILILIIGMLVIAVLIFWDRLFANPLNTRLNILVDRAFATLDPEALAWIREHWASGRAPHSLGDALFAAGLIERDFVGFTGVKDELKPIIAKKLKSIDAIWRRIAAKTMARVQGQAIPILLVSAWLLLTAALVIFLWQYWRSARAVADSPVTIVAGSGEMRGVDEKFYSPTVTQSQASLQAGLYVADIRLSFGELKKIGIANCRCVYSTAPGALLIL